MFQSHKARLKPTAESEQGIMIPGFQSHKARLKLLTEHLARSGEHVSIPQGSIKTVRDQRGDAERGTFQSHKARLKPHVEPAGHAQPVVFQSHKARLKRARFARRPIWRWMFQSHKARLKLRTALGFEKRITSFNPTRLD